MSKFSNFFKNKKDEDDFYIALVVIVLFLIGGFYFGSSLMSNESPIVLNDKTEQSTEIQGFQFENKEDEQLTTAILKDNKKRQQLDNWLDETPRMDSTDVEKITNQITANDDEIVESRGTNTDNREDNEANQIETELNRVKAEEAQKARIAEEAAAEEARKIAHEKLAADKAKADAKAKAELAAKEAQAKAQAEAKRKADEKAKAALAAKKAKEKAKVEAKRKADAKAKAATYNCAIIVGSFQTAEPADNLKASLIKQGYPAYTFFRKELKVVGIKQSCSNEKALQQQLAKIRKTFPEAWVLRK